MATRTQFNSKSPTIRRILREATELESSPSPDFTATPLEDNLFEWHFTLRGPPDLAASSKPLPPRAPNPSQPSQPSEPLSTELGPYANGIYHGRIVLPPTYPLSPPSFRFLTPSGRFETNREICLSISGHHEETWQPAWGLRTALVALRSFMVTSAAGQIGGIDTNDELRKRLAGESRRWRCGVCGRSNGEILRGSEEAAAKMEVEGREEKVPQELRLGMREDMVAAAAQTSGAQITKASSLDLGEGSSSNATAPSQPQHPEADAQDDASDAESTDLAEGFFNPSTPQAHNQATLPTSNLRPFPPSGPSFAPTSASASGAQVTPQTQTQVQAQAPNGIAAQTARDNAARLAAIRARVTQMQGIQRQQMMAMRQVQEVYDAHFSNQPHRANPGVQGVQGGPLQGIRNGEGVAMGGDGRPRFVVEWRWRRDDTGVPLWVDLAIYAVGACIARMVVRILLGI